MNEYQKDLLKLWVSAHLGLQNKKEVVFAHNNFILFHRKSHTAYLCEEEKFVSVPTLYSLHDMSKSSEDDLKLDFNRLEYWEGNQKKSDLISYITKTYIRR